GGTRGDRNGEERGREGLRTTGRPRDPRHRGAHRGGRRRRCSPLARDRPRDRGSARVSRPGQGDRDPRRPRHRGGEVDTAAAARHWAEVWEVAWPREDVEAIDALYAPGAVFYSHPFG